MQVKMIFLTASILLVFWLCAFQTSAQPGENTEGIKPPPAKIVPKEITIHGDTRIDNYFWLRERENPEVIAYIEAENAYTEAVVNYPRLKSGLVGKPGKPAVDVGGLGGEH